MADVEPLLRLYRVMVRIRAFEEAAEAALREGLVMGAVHLSVGQEAVAAGVCSALEKDDLVTSTHRGHGHAIAKGADVPGMMQELFGRAGGTCGGKGGSMHIADFSVGMLGANGVVAAGIPIAVGAAHAIKLRRERRVVVAFFGDGAANRGPFFEGLNWARVFDLPVLFVCEDNTYSATTRTAAVSSGPGLAARAESLGIPASVVDGNDVLAVADLAASLVAEIRAGGGPRFLHARTYRLKGHTVTDAAAYRPAGELAERLRDDPVVRAADRLRDAGVSAERLETLANAARDEMARAAAEAREAPWPAPESAFRDVQDIGEQAWSS